MFNKHLTVVIMIWLAVLGISVWKLFTLTIQDKEEYLALANGRSSKDESENRPPIQQFRQSVQKQILYTKNALRQQTRLKSGLSKLTCKTESNQTECIEDFQDMECQTQEISTKKDEVQDFRCFSAKNAVYSYKSGLLDANKVMIWHYEFSSTKWPEKIDTAQCLMQGSAQDVQLSLLRDPIMKAQEFRAIFYSPEENE